MRVFNLFLSLCGLAIAREASQDAFTQTAQISIQPISSTKNPITTLTEVKYNPSTLTSELDSFELPDLPSDAKLARVGIYDTATSQWKSSTSVTSTEIFEKGYAPTVVLSLDAQGEVIGVSLKGGSIDAGQTRDFGPKVKVLKMGKAKIPTLNKPKVVSDKAGVAGEEEVVEKTFLQKYWWMLLGVMVLAMSGGGGEEKK